MTPPTSHQTYFYKSSGVTNLQTESNYLDFQDLDFGVLGSLRLKGVGGWGVPAVHTVDAHCVVSNNDGHPHWGNPWKFPMMSYMCACMCVRACACVCTLGCLFPTPIRPTSPPPGGDPWNQSKFNSTSTKIFEFRLKRNVFYCLQIFHWLVSDCRTKIWVFELFESIIFE